MKAGGIRAARRKKKGVDAVAAQILLESWLAGERDVPLEEFPS